MNFKRLCEYLEILENTPSRNDKVMILKGLWVKTESGQREALLRLLTCFNYITGVNSGLILQSLEKIDSSIGLKAKIEGIDIAAEQVVNSVIENQIDLNAVILLIDTMSQTFGTGSGSQEQLVWILDTAFQNMSGKNAKHFVRILMNTPRTGVGTPTVLKMLSEVYQVDEEKIKNAYSVNPNIVELADKLENKEPLDYVTSIGSPTEPMLAQKVNSAKEALNQCGGKALTELKYDGIRVQIHKSGEEVRLFARSMRDITEQYPEVSEDTRSHITTTDRIVLDGEIVAVQMIDGKEKFLPFQTLMKRGKTHDIEQAMQDIPVRVFLFDVLNVNGVDYKNERFEFRRTVLENIVSGNFDVLRLSPVEVVTDPERLEALVRFAKANDFEGIMVKNPNSIYEAGKRSASWLKWKPSYTGKAVELDLVVVGAYLGSGKRAGTYGSLLLASKNGDTFETVGKVGTGFDDQTLAELPSMFEIVDEKPVNILANEQPDLWFHPTKVTQVIGDDLTKSPEAGGGISVRFPRFIRWRSDKTVDEANTSQYILEEYGKQSISEKLDC